ncbi:PCNA-interacting partner-like isoform X2 [Diadema setosum]|uniref:PCNA-interacting partner-like isoform X2 n=1 Tax=Diadema setosum TaxID=31175 RepID=UPI003B3AD6FF
MDLETAILTATTPVVIVDNNSGPALDDLLEELISLCARLCEKDDSTDIVLLGNRPSGDQTLQTLSQHFISLYRQHGLAANERQTVLSMGGHLQVVQLCLSEDQKQKHGIFEVDISEVLMMSEKVLQLKLSSATRTESTKSHEPSALSAGNEDTRNELAIQATEEVRHIVTLYQAMLKRCNMVDLVDVLGKVRGWMMGGAKEKDDTSSGQSDEMEKEGKKYVLLEPPENKVEEAMLEVLSGLDRSTSSAVTVLNIQASPHQDGDKDTTGVEEKMISVSMEMENLTSLMRDGALSQHGRTPKTPGGRNTTEWFTRQLVASHLRLLINSRDELSLAQCLSLPDKGLGLEGFTALRKVAREKKMPLYPTMVSFVMRLRLGGKSYQPDSSSPLGAYVKPMGEFVNLIQKMQTAAEETKDSMEAMRKVLTTIKLSILKSQGNVLRPSSVEKVITELTKEAETLAVMWQKQKEATPKKIIGQGRVIYGQSTICMLRDLVDRESGVFMSKLGQTQLLTDVLTSQKTPIRLPSVVSQFRSPDVESDPDSPENVSLRERLRNSLGRNDSTGTSLIGDEPKSFMLWAEPVVNIKTSFTPEKQPAEEAGIQVRANHNKGLWAVSPEDRSLAQKSEGGVACPLTSKVIDSIATTPKRKTNFIMESALDQENDRDYLEKLATKSKNKMNRQLLKKRLVPHDSSSDETKPAKKVKKCVSEKSRKKKDIPLGKGQRTLTHFFR